MTDREFIAKLSRAASTGIIAVTGAADALGLSSRAAALKLAAMARRGWLRRARRGLYLILPLEAEPGRPAVAEDPWLVAREAFSPCYIGGWSAAEHLGLTEQLFRSTLVMTAAPVRGRTITLLGHEYRLFRVPQAQVTDIPLVWRGGQQIAVSDRERTLLDCLQHPMLAGGIRHLADMMREYGQIPERNFPKLVAEAQQRDSGAVWKRLGYLAEVLWPEESGVAEAAQTRLSAGNIKLDPDVRTKGRLSRRWRLWINIPVSSEMAQT